MKFYWSVNNDPENWCSTMRSYYFPKAEWFMRRKYGQWLVLKYLALRIRIEDLCK